MREVCANVAILKQIHEEAFESDSSATMTRVANQMNEEKSIFFCLLNLQHQELWTNA